MINNFKADKIYKQAGSRNLINDPYKTKEKTSCKFIYPFFLFLL